MSNIVNELLNFKTPKRTKHYKTTRGYINAVYKLNRDRIKKAYELFNDQTETATRTRFYNNILEHAGESKTLSTRQIKVILKDMSRSTTFTPYSELFKLNVTKAIGHYKLFPAMRKMYGWRDWKKFDPEKLEYLGSAQYVYDNKVLISFTSSPESIRLGKVSKKPINMSSRFDRANKFYVSDDIIYTAKKDYEFQ